jgi:hypothetical protein
LQKRLYNKGFYVSKTHSLKKNDADTSSLLSIIKPGKEKKVATPLFANSKPNTAHIKEISFLNDCDTIVLRNGAQILVKITEVNPERIKYKYCDSPNEVLRTVYKNDVNYIVYANGHRETFEYKLNETDYHYQQPEDKKTNGFAIAGLVISMVNLPVSLATIEIAALNSGGPLVFNISLISSSLVIPSLIPFFLAFLSIVFCIIAIIQIKKNRESQKEKTLAVIGLVLSILSLFAALFVILLCI